MPAGLGCLLIWKQIDACGIGPGEEARLEMRDGLLVLVGGGKRTVDDVNQEIQEQRERRMRFVAGLSDEP